MTSDMTRTIAGYVIADLSCLARLEVALEVARELVEHDVELTGELGRAQDPDVVVREHVAVAGERFGERDAGLDLLRDVLEDVAEALVVRAFLAPSGSRRRSGCRRARRR